MTRFFTKTRISFPVLALITLLSVSCGKDDGGKGKGPDTPPVSEHTYDLRVMSFNIRYAGNKDDEAAGNGWDARKAACVQMVKHLQPDLLGLQEPKPVQWGYLKNALKSDYTLVSCTHPEDDPDNYMANTGNTVLMFRHTTLELLDYGHFFYGEDPTKQAIPYGSDDKNYRCAVWVKVKVRDTGHIVWFYTTHFPYDPNASKGSYNVEPRRLCAQQMVETMKRAAGESGICFTCGDLNCSFANATTSPSLAPLSAWLSSARQTAPVVDDWRSFNGWKKAQTGGTYSIDHIFYRHATPLSYETVVDAKTYGREFLSDHYPILFVCRLEEADLPEE